MTETDTARRPEGTGHRLVLDAAAGPEPVSYHVVTSGPIRAVDDERPTDNAGAFGHADGQLATSRHEYEYEGRLLSIKVRPSLVDLDVRDHRDAPFEISVDGDPIDFERWDPSRGDLPLGYGGVGALPDDVDVDGEDCDRVASTRAELLAASDTLDDSGVLGIDADVRLPEEPDVPLSFPQGDLTLVGLETDDGGHPVLSRERTPEGYGNVALQLAGDRTAVLNLQFRGPLEEHVPYDEYDGRLRGVECSGADQVAINCHGWHWPHSAFSATGAGETYLCLDSHHNMLGGLGYGFSASGPLPSHDWDAGETWTDEEVDTVRPWHRRTQIERVRLDANRHDVAAGYNASYELRRFVIGPTAVTSTRIDMHRPGGGTVTVGDGIVEESTQGVTDGGEKGVGIRGWPNVGVRVEDTWFTWGDEPEPEHRYPGDTPAIAQMAATADTRNRRGVWDSSDDPFIRVEWHDCAFGPDDPDWLPEELRRARAELPEAWDVSGP